jgi:hypothetical protein
MGKEIFDRKNTAIRKSPSEISQRRHQTADIFSHILPSEVTLHNDALEEARQMRADGFSFIIPYAHSKMRDPVDAIRTIIDFGEFFDDAEYSGPVAYHQDTFYMKHLASRVAMDAKPIVTAHTIAKGKNFEPVPLTTKAREVFSRATHHFSGSPLQELNPPKALRLGHGQLEYNKTAAETLLHQGFVFIAPQGQRKEELGEPVGRPIEMIIREAKRTGMDMNKIAIWTMGIMALDKDSGNHSTNHGFLANIGKEVAVELGVPITLAELQSIAKERSLDAGREINIDEQIFEELAGLLPLSYSTESTLHI